MTPIVLKDSSAFRDLGGLPAEGGRRVRAGKLYRSAHRADRFGRGIAGRGRAPEKARGKVARRQNMTWPPSALIVCPVT